MAPQIFGWQHLLYIAIFFVFTISSTFLFKRYVNEKYYVKIIKGFAFLNLCLVIWNRLCNSNYQLSSNLIPSSFCCTSGFLSAILLLVLKKESKVLQFILFAAAFGGLLTTIYPDFLPQDPSFFYDRTISGLLYHTGMLYLFILTLSVGYFKPSLKNWSAFPLGLCVYVTWGYFANTILGQSNNMVLNEPILEGTIFYWYVLGVLLIIVYTLFLLIYEKFLKIFNSKNSTDDVVI